MKPTNISHYRHLSNSSAINDVQLSYIIDKTRITLAWTEKITRTESERGAPNMQATNRQIVYY